MPAVIFSAVFEYSIISLVFFVLTMSCAMSCSFALVLLPVIVTVDKASLFPVSQSPTIPRISSYSVENLLQSKVHFMLPAIAAMLVIITLTSPGATAICDRGGQTSEAQYIALENIFK